MNRQTRGKRVEFVRNRVADDVCREIRRSVERSRNVNFRPNACFIFGASGAGKTRLGWQAAQALEPPSRATFPSVIPGYFHIAVDELVGVDVAALYGLNQGVAWRSKIPSRAVKLVKARDSNDAAEYLAAHLVNRNRHPEMVHHYKGKLLSEVMQEWASAIRDEALQKWERANTEHVWRAKEQAEQALEDLRRAGAGQVTGELLQACEAAALACDQAVGPCQEAREAFKTAADVQRELTGAEKEGAFKAAVEACKTAADHCKAAQNECREAGHACDKAAGGGALGEPAREASESSTHACANAAEACEQAIRACERARGVLDLVWQAQTTTEGTNEGIVPVCLVVHMDEFHHFPWASACMARAVCAVNGSLSDGVFAVPVLTGLTTAETKQYTEAITGKDHPKLRLPFFRPLSKKAKQVVINAFKAVVDEMLKMGRHQHREERREELYAKLTLATFAEVPWLLYQLEDVSGWTLGLVCLGAALAALAKSRKAPLRELTDADIAHLEKDLHSRLRESYSRQGLVDKLGIASDGVPKLFWLAVTSFEVSTCVCVCVCGGTRLW